MNEESEKQPGEKSKPRRWERKGGTIGFLVGLVLGMFLNIPQILALFRSEALARELGEITGGLICPSFAGGILGAIIGWFVGKAPAKP